ncbi:1493_t:CDS:2, partial [Dentiscutata heterogama]
PIQPTNLQVKTNFGKFMEYTSMADRVAKQMKLFENDETNKGYKPDKR